MRRKEMDSKPSLEHTLVTGIGMPDRPGTFLKNTEGCEFEVELRNANGVPLPRQVWLEINTYVLLSFVS